LNENSQARELRVRNNSQRREEIENEDIMELKRENIKMRSYLKDLNLCLNQILENSK
jgi:hypothetical protein